MVFHAAVTHLDLEESLVAPSVVPRVHTEPLVKTRFVSPADDFDGVATKDSNSSVLINKHLKSR